MHLDKKQIPGIYNADDLCAFAFAVNNNKTLRPWQTEDGKVHLKADIDLLGVDYKAIAATSIFTGVFDGEGHVISNISIRKKLGAVGLFATNCGMIKNVHIRCADFESFRQASVGGIAGCNRGIIMGCSSEGNFTMGDEIGGIAGRNEGYVLECFIVNMKENHINKWKHSPRNKIGGIVGENTGTIFGCYSKYFPYHLLYQETDFHYGIIVGKNNGTVSHCYWQPSQKKIKNQVRGIGNLECEDTTICTQQDTTETLNSCLTGAPVFCEYKFTGIWPHWKFERRSEKDGILTFEEAEFNCETYDRSFVSFPTN